MEQLGGATRRKDLVRVGITDYEIALARQAGLIERPLRGVLTLPDVPLEFALACYFTAQLSCLSAAAHHDLRILRRPSRPHLELDFGRGGHKRASTPHLMAHLHRSRTHRPGRSVASVARAIDMASNCVPALDQLVLLDHAMAEKKIARSQIDQFTVTPAPIRGWLRLQADPLAGSVSETCARVALKRAGLDLVSQAPLGDGRFADFLVHGCLYVEIDGYEFHSDPKQFAEDRARDRYLISRGFRVLRFTYADAVHHPQQLVADVLAALRVPVKTPNRVLTL